jgi:hypothetical protein
MGNPHKLIHKDVFVVCLGSPRRPWLIIKGGSEVKGALYARRWRFFALPLSLFHGRKILPLPLTK